MIKRKRKRKPSKKENAYLSSLFVSKKRIKEELIHQDHLRMEALRREWLSDLGIKYEIQ